MKTTFLPCVAIALGLLCIPFFAQGTASFAATRAEIVKSSDIPYAAIEGVDANSLCLDIYVPQGAEGAPVLVMVHGGGWRAGDKRNRGVGPNLAERYCGEGFVFASVNYRLVPAGKHPANVQDVAKAIAWIHDHAAEYGGDPDSIALMGHSAGAHLAALVATDARRLEAEGKPLGIVKRVVLLDTAAYDITRYMREFARPGMERLYRNAFGGDEASWRDASPMSHVAPGKGIPPMLAFYTGSRMAANVLANAFADALAEAGSPSRAVDTVVLSHGEILRMAAAEDHPIAQLTLRFLNGEDATAFPERLPQAGGEGALTPIPEEGTHEADGGETPASASKGGLHSAAQPPPRSAEGTEWEFRFTRDFVAGSLDVNGRAMNASECNAIAAHRGMLFAGMTYISEDRREANGRILVKRSADGPWEMDVLLGEGHARVSTLASIEFGTDHTGKVLDAPVPVLMASDWNLRRGGRQQSVGVWARDDHEEEWTRLVLSTDVRREGRTHGGNNPEIRKFIDHIDRVTGIHYVFAFASNGSIYRGAYDETARGGLRWERIPELSGLVQRPVSAAVADGVVFTQFAVPPDVKRAESGGLYRRVDGHEPRWERVEVPSWLDPDNPVNTTRTGAMRGLTTLPASEGATLIFSWKQPNYTIERLVPSDPELEPVAELNVREYFATLWGRQPARHMIIGYNEFTPATHPDTGERAHLIGLFAVPRGYVNRPHPAWLLIRRPDGTYLHAKIEPEETDALGLRGLRTICESPFKEEKGRVFYFGGFDMVNTRAPGNHAWIFRGEIPQKENDLLFALAFEHDRPTSQATALLDMSGDGRLDLAVASKRQVHFIRNLGNSRYEHFRTERVDRANGWGLHDFNADGRMDLFVAQPHRRVPSVWLNNGDGTFVRRSLGNETLGTVRSVLFADFDGDGLMDAFHTVSSFGTNRSGCQLHPGLPGGGFGPDAIEEILDPAIPGFWHAVAHHPERGPERRANKMVKGAIVRDLDGDGKPDIVFGAYADRGFQEDRFAVDWIDRQDRGLFILHNQSEPGKIRFAEVAKSAVGEDAWGGTERDWNVYAVIPVDYNRNGKFDLFVGATVRRTRRGGREDTVAVRFFENVSEPGAIRFVDRTEEAGFARMNAPDERGARNFASGAAVDFDNDGFVDLVLVNRRSADLTPFAYPHLFRNMGDGTFAEIPPEVHGLGNGSGGRDLVCGDLTGNGFVDIVINDGTAGGFYGLDTTRIYENRARSSNNWIQLAVAANEKGTPAIGAKVWVYEAGTENLLGFDEVRTDFAYRSKRSPTLHFGLGEVEQVDVRVLTRGGVRMSASGLVGGRTHSLFPYRRKDFDKGKESNCRK